MRVEQILGFCFTWGRIHVVRRRQDFGGAAAGGHFVKNPRAAGREDNHLAVGAPGATPAMTREWTNSNGCAALNGNLSQFRACRESDEFAVGRPKGFVRAFRTLDCARLLLVKILDVQLSRRFGPDERDVFSVGGDRGSFVKAAVSHPLGWGEGEAPGRIRGRGLLEKGR